MYPTIMVCVQVFVNAILFQSSLFTKFYKYIYVPFSSPLSLFSFVPLYFSPLVENAHLRAKMCCRCSFSSVHKQKKEIEILALNTTEKRTKKPHCLTLGKDLLEKDFLGFHLDQEVAFVGCKHFHGRTVLSFQLCYLQKKQTPLIAGLILINSAEWVLHLYIKLYHFT